jgi:hypothetical protein
MIMASELLISTYGYLQQGYRIIATGSMTPRGIFSKTNDSQIWSRWWGGGWGGGGQQE